MQRIHRGEKGPSNVVIVLCALVTMLEGVDLQSGGLAAPRLAPSWHLNASALGWFFSMSTFGMMLGAAVGGRVSDRFGRKTLLLASVATFGLASTACALAQSFEPLVIARFVTGLGMGSALPNVLAIVVESGIASHRSFSIGVLHAGLPVGGALASVLMLFGGGSEWQLVFWVGGIVPLLLLPLLAAGLPANHMSGTQPISSTDTEHAEGVLRALFGQGRASATLMLWMAFMCAVLFPYLLLYWLPTFLMSRGVSQSTAFVAQTLFGLFGAVGSLAVGALMDRLPRPNVVMAVFLILMFALVVLALAPGHIAISLLAGSLIGLAVSGAQASVYALAPTVYPAAVRGTGLGAAIGAGRVGAVMGPLLVVGMLGRGGSAGHVLLSLLPIAFVAGLAAHRVARIVRIRDFA